jgi:hypothetical protein
VNRVTPPIGVDIAYPTLGGESAEPPKPHVHDIRHGVSATPAAGAAATHAAAIRSGNTMRTLLPRPGARRPLAIWGLILACGAALLYARYDWSLASGFIAKRGFALSLYLLSITVPTTFYLARRTLHDTRVAVALTAFVFVVFTLPYKLLGLVSIYYYRTRPQAFEVYQFPLPHLQFLPGGTLRAFPFDWLFMPLLFALGAACVWGVWWLRRRAGFSTARIVPLLLTAAFAVICLQAFFHSGMRGPYTYLSYFQRPKEQQHWYLVYHFADGSGASQGDQFAFSPLEDYFQGAPRYGDNELIRRPFSFYVESQFSYFINDFYCWLALNCLFWLVAIFATARLVGRLTTPRAGYIAGALTLVGPGFIAFVAQPNMYLQNYAAAAVALCAFEDLVVSPADGGARRPALFTGILALCALVYDLETIIAVALVYGLARRVPWRPLIVPLAAAVVMLEGFTFLVTDVLHITIISVNGKQLSIGIRDTLHLLLHPSLSRWYDTTVTVVPSFLREWLQAFFVIPALIAPFGLRQLRDRGLQVLVAALFIVGFLTIAVLQIGGQQIGFTPRLIYPTFIGVYLPAAVALDSLARRAPVLPAVRNIERRLRRAAPWIVVAIMALLVNVDVFGYPTLYVEYFVGTPPVFLPG